MSKKTLRIVSGPSGSEAKILLDGEPIGGELHVTSVLIEGGQLNRAFIEVQGVELDVEAVVDEDAQPSAKSLDILLRSEISRLSERIASLEEQLTGPGWIAAAQKDLRRLELQINEVTAAAEEAAKTPI